MDPCRTLPLPQPHTLRYLNMIRHGHTHTHTQKKLLRADAHSSFLFSVLFLVSNTIRWRQLLVSSSFYGMIVGWGGLQAQDSVVAILVNLNISTAQPFTVRNRRHHVVETPSLGSTQGNCISRDQKMKVFFFVPSSLELWEEIFAILISQFLDAISIDAMTRFLWLVLKCYEIHTS